MRGEVTGEIEKQDGVLVIKRIHVVYHLKADEKNREAIERTFEMHPKYCPVYRTLHTAINITTELVLED